MATNSSATYTATPAPAKPPTTTEVVGWTAARRSYCGARAAFLLVTLGLTLPTPYSAFWGGNTVGLSSLMMIVAVAWAGSLALGATASRAAGIGTRAGESYFGVILCGDVLFITALLWSNGAAQNPFTLLYFVPITLATMVASRWTFRVAGLSVLGFACLLWQTSVEIAPHAEHAAHAHFFHHVRGMALALAVAGAFVTYFAQRIARDLAAQRLRIEQLSREQQENRFAISLGALSAGAAHELGSPLGTVQLLVEEIPHLSASDRDQALVTIREQLQRTKSILHQMDSSELSAHVLGDGASWSFGELVSVAEEIGIACSGRALHSTTQPRTVVSQILRELVRNAQRVASQDGVALHLESTDELVRLSVHDDGPSLSDEQLLRATEPFVSDTGGTGLGLFLATVHARQLGGRLTLRRREGRGTTASLELPRNPPSSHLQQGAGRV